MEQKYLDAVRMIDRKFVVHREAKVIEAGATMFLDSETFSGAIPAASANEFVKMCVTLWAKSPLKIQPKLIPSEDYDGLPVQDHKASCIRVYFYVDIKDQESLVDEIREIFESEGFEEVSSTERE